MPAASHDTEVAQLQADLEEHITRGAHPLLIAAREELLAEAIERAQDEAEGLYRLRKAILLAPTIELCEALLRGEQVPRRLLKQRWIHRLEARHRRNGGA